MNRRSADRRSGARPSPAAAVLLVPALLVPALLAAVVLVAGCGSGGKSGRKEVFRQVTAPVAFEMMHDTPGLTVLDLRPAAEFHGPLGHIRGALSVPWEHRDELLRDIAWLRDRTFLIYCRVDECEPAAIDYYRSHGFDNAMLIHGGIEAWVGGGFGTVGADDPPDHHDG